MPSGNQGAASNPFAPAQSPRKNSTGSERGGAMAFSFNPSTISSSSSSSASPSSSLFGSASSQSSSSVFSFNFSSTAAAAAVDAPTPSSLFSGSIPSFVLGTAVASTDASPKPLFGSVTSLPPFRMGPTVISSTPVSSSPSLISNSASISATISPASETLALAASNSSSEAAATSSTVSASQSATLSSRAADLNPIGSSIPLDFVVPYQLTKLPVFQGVLNDFKEELRCRTFKRLQELANLDNLTAETGFEIADSVELLKVLNASDSALETIGAKARDGATTLQEAAFQLARGQASLRAVSDEITAYLQ